MTTSNQPSIHPGSSGPLEGKSSRGLGQRPDAPQRGADSTVDESGSPWAPSSDHESGDESPLRLTLARAAPADDGTPCGVWHPLVDRVRLASGKRVPGTRYRIVRWLGEGGMGMVFEALHVDIQRSVALKILKPGVAGASRQRDRFLDEARAVASVESRFVVDVLDFGELPDGRPFYTMELLDPVSLYDENRAGPMPIERALPILRQCCKALAAVHSRGIAHRDVKPQNVLIQTEDGRSDAVRIVDFGIAARFGTKPQVAGTAMYMAPEQIRGADFDGRLDIYGLGCMAYELLTGTTPFEGTTATELVQRHLDNEVVAPSVRRPSLPAALDAVLLRCLAKRPAERYANMHELEAALCEVQIAVGFTTAWDDLPLPAIADERRTELRRRMPHPSPQRRRLGPRLRVIAAAFVVGLISAAALMSVSAEPTAYPTEFNDSLHTIQVQTEAARLAGSRAYWAYPPHDWPDYPTALRVVTALEGEPGSLRYLAQVRALELRHEFAETLVRLGDQYWDAPNGRPFAAEYYAQALLFDPGQARARERTNMTPAQLAEVAARAAAGDLSPAEVEVGEVLRALAEPDEIVRRERIETWLADASPSSSSLELRSQLASLIGIEQSPPTLALTSEPAPPIEPDRDRLSRARGRGLAKPTSSKVDQAAAKTAEQPAVAASASAESRARDYTERAEAALARGDRDRAERLFGKALVADPQLGSAHAGLAEVHFARGRYQEAMTSAGRAARALPRDPDLQLLLGDACLKTLRYDDARRAYERARTLGHEKAAARLQQIDEVDR